MDPNACVDLAIDALRREDLEEAREHLINLWNWLSKDGFSPKPKKLAELICLMIIWIGD